MSNRTYIRTLFVMVVLLANSYIATAEKVSDINSTITNMMEKIQNKQEPNEISEEQLKNTDPNIILSILALYEKSPSDMVKRNTYQQEFRLAQLQPSSKVRQEVTARLVKELTDPNSNINPYPYGLLLKFKADDFGPAAKELIRQNLDKNNRRGETIMLVGVANIIEEQSRLKGLLIDELAYQAEADKTGKMPWYFTLGWRARLALARMGVKEDINKCVELVESELEGKLPRILSLFHDIGYIRQPEAIDFLMTYVFSDETIGQVKPTAPGEPVASYVMGILVDCLENFPIKKREERGYKPEEIEVCRKWMSEQKEWKIIR